ncbi:MAG: mechanosensitive ion channel [Caldilineaceae bacterium]|nr:mechanosensitive ion channel [Caldilineaceae bacterium]
MAALEALAASPFYPALLTIGVVLLVGGLLGLVSGLVRWLLQRLAPTWITPIVVGLQSLVWLGGVALLVWRLQSDAITSLLAVTLLLLVALAFRTGNLISDGVATFRIRTFGYYHKGDWLTLQNGVQGAVVAIRPFSTLLQTAQREQWIVNNSLVIAGPLLVHPPGLAPQAARRADAVEPGRQGALAMGELDEAGLALATPLPLQAHSSPVQRGADNSDRPLGLPQAAGNGLPVAPTAQRIAPLARRTKLGKISIKSF